MEKIKVFGHKSPDTDATGCALLWAWYMNEHTPMDATPYVLGELNKETEFVLERWKVTSPELLETVTEKDTVVIVDTNNPQELPDGLEKATIMEIIDHHQLAGGLATLKPLAMTIRPLASTASVIFDLWGLKIADLPEHIAGIMLSCILSDTLEFRSPTTTPHDKDIAEQLAARLEVTIEEYAQEMFAAKSDLSDFSDTGVVRLDSKKFKVGDMNFRISVAETTTPDSILKRKEGLVSAMQEITAEESDIDGILFFVIDIFKEEATVLVHNDVIKQVIEASFGVKVESDTEVLPGIVSRKKQIVPALKF